MVVEEMEYIQVSPSPSVLDECNFSASKEHMLLFLNNGGVVFVSMFVQRSMEPHFN